MIRTLIKGSFIFLACLVVYLDGLRCRQLRKAIDQGLMAIHIIPSRNPRI